MKHRNLRHFSAASIVAILVCCFAYTVSASLGYLTFGSNVNPDILLNYGGNRPEVLIGIVAMAVKTIFTYPILLYCGREAFKTAIKDAKIAIGIQSSSNIDDSLIVRLVIVILWFILSLLCAVLVPNIGEVISFLGCLAAYFIFILPGMCLIAITAKSGKRPFEILISCNFLTLKFNFRSITCTQNKSFLHGFGWPFRGDWSLHFRCGHHTRHPRHGQSSQFWIFAILFSS